MAHLLSRLSLKAEAKPIAYRIYDLNRRLCHEDGRDVRTHKPFRNVRFHMGGVPYDMEIEEGKDGERFVQRFYSAIDRKAYRRSVVTYEELCRRLLATAIYEEDYTRLIESALHHVHPERHLCVSENGFFRAALQLYLYLGSRVRSLESYDDGKEYVRFLFRVDGGDVCARFHEADVLPFRDAAFLLGHENSFLYRYLVHSAIAAGADALAEIRGGDLVFSLGIPFYDSSRFSFYGVGSPTDAEICEMHAGAYQVFASFAEPPDPFSKNIL